MARFTVRLEKEVGMVAHLEVEAESHGEAAVIAEMEAPDILAWDFSGWVSDVRVDDVDYADDDQVPKDENPADDVEDE
jgi:hypothetical protein